MAQTAESRAVFAARVRARRQELGLRQGELALEAGVAEPTISYWEVGRLQGFPHPGNMSALARALRVSAEYLRGETDDPTPGTQTAADVTTQATGAVETEGMRFGRRVKTLRVAQGRSRRDLAQAARVSEESVRKWEDGCLRRTPRQEALEHLAVLLGVSPAYLAGETDDPAPEAAGLPVPSVPDGQLATLVPLSVAMRAVSTTRTVLDVLVSTGRIAATPGEAEPLVDLSAVIRLFPPPPPRGLTPIVPGRPVPGATHRLGPDLRSVVGRHRVTTRTLQTLVTRAGSEVLQALGMAAGARVAYRCAVDRVDGRPFRLAGVWSPARDGDQWWKGPDEEAIPRLPPQADDVVERTVATRADAESALALEVVPDEPVLYTEQRVYAEGEVLYVAGIVCPLWMFAYWTRYRPRHEDPPQAWPWRRDSPLVPLFPGEARRT